MPVSIYTARTSTRDVTQLASVYARRTLSQTQAYAARGAAADRAYYHESWTAPRAFIYLCRALHRLMYL